MLQVKVVTNTLTGSNEKHLVISSFQKVLQNSNTEAACHFLQLTDLTMVVKFILTAKQL